MPLDFFARRTMNDELISVAAKAFQEQLPTLLRKHSGEWVAFHGGELIDVLKDAKSLYKSVQSKKIPIEEVLIRNIEPGDQNADVYLNW